MKRGIAKPERNNGQKLTLPYRTQNVKDAMLAYKAGKDINIMAGYFEEEGMDIGDFYMLDQLEKQYKIAEFRSNLALLKEEQQQLTNQLKQHYYEQNNQAQTPGPGPASSGPIPQPGDNSQSGGNTKP